MKKIPWRWIVGYLAALAALIVITFDINGFGHGRRRVAAVAIVVAIVIAVVATAPKRYERREQAAKAVDASRRAADDSLAFMPPRMEPGRDTISLRDVISQANATRRHTGLAALDIDGILDARIPVDKAQKLTDMLIEAPSNALMWHIDLTGRSSLTGPWRTGRNS